MRAFAVATSAARRSAAAASTRCRYASTTAAPSDLLTPQLVADFHRDGIICVPNFISHAECDALRAQAEQYIREEGERREREGDGTSTVFSTTSHDHSAEEYFMTSGDKVRFFLEKGCTKVTADTVNKIAHGLHVDNNGFQQFVSQQKFRGLLRKLGQRSPNVIQSMYILKPPKVGGVVVPHQDSTWLYTSPMSVIGVWFALDDCNIENACLLALKGSKATHPVECRDLLDEGSKINHKLVGDLPKVPLEAMEPIECPKGSLVLFDGQTVHGSAPNMSTKSRHAFVFHSVDDRAVWCERNWIAPSVGRLAL
jgi:phytanoyl-CoA hydroxylase